MRNLCTHDLSLVFAVVVFTRSSLGYCKYCVNYLYENSKLRTLDKVLHNFIGLGHDQSYVSLPVSVQ